MSPDPGLFGRIGRRLEETGSTRPDRTATFSTAELLDLDDGERSVMQLVMRNGPASIAEIAEVLSIDPATAESSVDRLASRGAVDVQNGLVQLHGWSRRTSPGGI